MYFLKIVYEHIKWKDTVNIDPKILSTSNGKSMILSKCTISGSKKSRFVKNQEAKGLLSNLGIRAPLSKVSILGDILFWCVRTCLKDTICS